MDRYGDYLVLQALSQGMDRLTADVVRALVDEVSPAGILARNDPRVRELEGLPRAVEVLHGDVPASVPVREGFVADNARDAWMMLWLDGVPVVGVPAGAVLDVRDVLEDPQMHARRFWDWVGSDQDPVGPKPYPTGG